MFNELVDGPDMVRNDTLKVLEDHLKCKSVCLLPETNRRNKLAWTANSPKDLR